MTFWSSWGFQDACSPLMEQLIFFHDHSMIIIVLIISLVVVISLFLVLGSLSGRYLVDSQGIEVVWTVLPGVILFFLAFPSLRLLYLFDEINMSGVTLKVLGHQWYWTYEFSDFLDVEYDSYMLPMDELFSGENRLLEVDHRAVVPHSTDIRILVSSDDVLHCWSVPSMGMKVDAVPGRLNQLSFFCYRSGIFYGQCSEICGANHSFMPIVVEAVSVKDFVESMKSVG